MNIVIIISETSLWKPRFVNDLIESLPTRHSIAGIVITSFKPVNLSRLEYLKRYYAILGFTPFFAVIIRELMFKLFNISYKIFNKPNIYSIEGVCRKFKIPVIKTTDINKEDTIEWIKQFEPDLLFNSCHQVYSERLLTLPEKYCINRHSSLLPGYRGVYPIFWNLLNDEKEAGVTVHIMEKKLDAGKIIVQAKIPINKEDTLFSLYNKCFKLSVGLVLESVEKLDSDSWAPVVNDIKPSYFSYPANADCKQFRRKGKRIF